MSARLTFASHSCQTFQIFLFINLYISGNLKFECVTDVMNMKIALDLYLGFTNLLFIRTGKHKNKSESKLCSTDRVIFDFS